MFKFYNVPVFAFLCITLVYSAKFPDNWTKCPKTGERSECLFKAMEFAIKSLKNGSRPLSIIPVDPLHFEVMNIQQGVASPVNINLTFYDVDLIGASRLTVTNADVDWENYKLDMSFKVSGPIDVLGDYSISGKVLVLPIQGLGKANISLDDFSGKLMLKGKEMIKNSKKYFDVTDGSFQVDAGKCRIYLGNLFNGVPNLGENMNKFLNENWKEIIDELKEPISSVMGEAIRQIANVFFHKVPIDQIYTT